MHAVVSCCLAYVPLEQWPHPGVETCRTAVWGHHCICCQECRTDACAQVHQGACLPKLIFTYESGFGSSGIYICIYACMQIYNTVSRHFTLCYIIAQCICTLYLPLKVLSRTTSEAMNYYGIPGSAATQTFLVFMDRFFDMLNVRHPDESIHKRKEDLRPYRSVDDERLQVKLSSHNNLYNKYIDCNAINARIQAISHRYTVAWRWLPGVSGPLGA